MYKAQPVYHSGLPIVQLSKLPNNQYNFLSKCVPSGSFIHISIDGGEAEECIPYEDYEHCFQLLHADYFESYFDSQL